MQVRLNGKEHETRAQITVAGLLRDLELVSERVAVAVNGELVIRGEYPSRQLLDGDEVEIIHAVAGG